MREVRSCGIWARRLDTAARAAKGLHELIHDQEQVEFQVSAMLGKTFPAKYTEMVISKHNTAFGVCPHHLLPVVYRISMAYIPVDKVLGLSKLSRLARIRTGLTLRVMLHFGLDVQRARPVRLDEQPADFFLTHNGRDVGFHVPPHALRTLRITFA